MLGFMVVTAFLSMWISNTATTAMMLPIVQAILEQLSKAEAEKEEKELMEGRDNQAFELAEVTTTKLPMNHTKESKSINTLFIYYKYIFPYLFSKCVCVRGFL